MIEVGNGVPLMLQTLSNDQLTQGDDWPILDEVQY